MSITQIRLSKVISLSGLTLSTMLLYFCANEPASSNSTAPQNSSISEITRLKSVNNTAPEFTAIDDKTVTAYDELSVSLEATDADGDQLTFSITGGPSAAKIENNKFIWTPDRNDIGETDISLKVTDGTDDAAQQFKVIVETVTVPRCSVIVFLSPRKDEVYKVGDTLKIVWARQTDLTIKSGVMIEFTIDFFDMVNLLNQRIKDTDADYVGNIGEYKWVIPEELTTDPSDPPISTVSDEAYINIETYYHIDPSCGLEEGATSNVYRFTDPFKIVPEGSSHIKNYPR
ncbi:MAG: hypothetical protein GF398_02885 [Chitinivibrionales bacterium]|nr:hypothetical protein [Chitinivibrionales bacterium]